jgi:agmatinase
MRQFLELEIIRNYSESEVVILPIPYEATTTYRKGCERGPLALLEASDQLECYDDELDQETCLNTKIFTENSIADTRNNRLVSPQEMLEVTTETVARLISDGKFVIAVGGEHAITTGVVQAYVNRLNEAFTVIQIDAHGDMRYSYEGSLHNHACVMRRILEFNLPTLPIGIRSICQEEVELINKHNIPVFYARNILNDPNWIDKAIAKISTNKVFITIDLDGFDPSLIPGVGTPEPGGLNWYESLNFFRRIFENFEVIGCDIMELSPLTDSVVSEFTAAKLLYKLIGYYSKFTSDNKLVHT